METALFSDEPKEVRIRPYFWCDTYGDMIQPAFCRNRRRCAKTFESCQDRIKAVASGQFTDKEI